MEFTVKKGTRFLEIGKDNKLVEGGLVINVVKFDDVEAGLHTVEEDHIPVYTDDAGRTFVFTHTIDKKSVGDNTDTKATTTECPEEIPVLQCLSAKDISDWEHKLFIEDVNVIVGCFFRSDNIKNCLLDTTRTFTDKQGAVGMLGDLLSGSYHVDVNSGNVDADGYGGKHYSIELYNVLKALGVKTVPLDILGWMNCMDGDGSDDEQNDLQIKDLHSLSKTQACGLIAEIFDGVTQVDGETEILNCCYGSYPQSYGTVKEVMDYDTREEFLKDLDTYWGQLIWERAMEEEKKTAELVSRFVDLLLS